MQRAILDELDSSRGFLVFKTQKFTGLAAVDPVEWKLEVSGLVMKPASFNLTDIQAMFQHEVTSVHECAGHVGCARFLKFCPGWVNTEMDMADPAGGSYTDADIVGRVPMARFATPDEVARAIAFLADT